MNRTFIDVSGYGFTGKTIISDYLKYSKKVKSFHNTFEFELFRVENGIFDLYLNSQLSWSLVRSSQKIKKFKELIYRIGKQTNKLRLKSYFNSGHCYQNIFNQKFIEISYEFINDITEFSQEGFWPYENLSNSPFELFLNKIKNFLFKKPVYSNIYYSNRNKFNISINLYLQKLFDEICRKDEEYILLNNSFEPFDTHLFLDLINNSKSIIVDRDPRDIYSSMLNSSKANFSNFENDKTISLLKSTSIFEDINLFIKRYALLRENTNYFSHKNLMRINFEDFILKSQITSNKINDFLGLKIDTTRAKDLAFKSRRNIGIWKMYKHLPEIKLIEKKLGKYCIK